MRKLWTLTILLGLYGCQIILGIEEQSPPSSYPELPHGGSLAASEAGTPDRDTPDGQGGRAATPSNGTPEAKGGQGGNVDPTSTREGNPVHGDGGLPDASLGGLGGVGGAEDGGAGATGGSTQQAGAGGGDDEQDGGHEPIDPCGPSAVFGTPERVIELNQNATQLGLRLSYDGLTGYLAIGEPETSAQKAYLALDLYVTTRPHPNGSFGTPVRLKVISKGYPIVDSNPFVSADGNVLYWESGDHIYRAKRNQDASFDSPELLRLTAGLQEREPYVLPDNTAFYLASNSRALVVGSNYNIYRLEIEDGLPRGPGQLLTLNTDFDERAPVVSADERMLYFASDNGSGSFDIWVASRARPSDPFKRERRVRELSSEMHEFPSYISEDGCTLYFAREKQPQQFEIYRARRGRVDTVPETAP